MSIRRYFSNVLVAGFRNGKSLKDYLVRTALPKTNETGRYTTSGKKTYLLCNCITFKIQSGPLNYNLEKVLYLLKCKVW